MTVNRKPVKYRKGNKWRPEMVVEIYKLVKAGLNMAEIAEHCGIRRDTLYKNWMVDHPELKAAIEMAQRELAEDESFPDFIFRRLPSQLKEVWKKITKLEKMNNGVAEIEAILQDNGKRARQQLFLYALCVEVFDVSKALMKVNLKKRELDYWINNDPGFAELMEEITWHKGNFCEGSLFRLVAAGVPAAVIFANKTLNRDRGYEPRMKMDVEHSGQIMHGVVELSEIMERLPHNIKIEVLEAIRKLDQEKNPRLTVQDRIGNEIIATARGDTTQDEKPENGEVLGGE